MNALHFLQLQAYQQALRAVGGNVTAMELQFWGQVGMPEWPRDNFDDIYQAIITVFRVRHTCS